MVNRLGSATSPYLLQHADNPVHWWEWSPDAFTTARERGVPVLLSVGYAACHWCHVMAHESFEDDATAAYMNEHFVNVKVDREERPDVDAIYMQATQAMTGHGGWPMTVVMTPEGEPFFCGTYFPDKPRHGQPAFTQVLQALTEAWRERREEIDKVAADVKAHLQSSAMPPGDDVTEEVLTGAVRTLAREYDAVAAGFGGAPKFPPSMVLEFLLRVSTRATTEGDDAMRMVDATMHAMARGGLYDQLAGGFARYSVDNDWVVPHFEKMLYDNAQLLGLYARWWRRTGDPLGERVVRETATFLVDELGTPEGGFASALDADSEGEEGRFYVWTPAQLVEALGEDDGRWAAALLSVTDAGTFEQGSSTLQLREDPDDADRWARVRTTLREARAGRVRPARDDKVVAAWNGLAIAALAEAGMILDDDAMVDAAARAARLVLDVHVVDGRLRRVSRDGVHGDRAVVLEDYACMAGALVTLHRATAEPAYLEPAERFLEVALTEFAAEDGGWYDTPVDAEALLARPRDPSDNASPSGHSALLHALLDWAALTGSGRHRDAAESGLRQVHRLAERVPRFAGWSLAAAAAALAGPVEVVVVGEPGDPEREALLRTARRTTSPGAVVVSSAPGGADAVPLLEGKGLVDGRAAAYVCRGMVCRRPVTTVEDLLVELAAG